VLAEQVSGHVINEPENAYSKRRTNEMNTQIQAGRRFGKIVLPEFSNQIDPSAPIMGPDPGRSYDKHVGEVFFANDSWFTTTYYSEPLTNYLVGWRDPNNIEETLAFYAPQVAVPGRLFEFKSATNAEEFLSEVYDDERAIGADFKKVVYTGTDTVAKTLNRGLGIVIDLDKVSKGGMGGAGPAPWQQNTVAKLTRRLWRNSLRRAITAISAGATAGTGLRWIAVPPGNTSLVPPNPDMDIQAELVTATDTSGIRPNRVGYGDSSWLYRNQAYGAQNNPAGFMGYGPGDAAEKMAAALGVDKVHISRERYQSAAASKTQVVGANVNMFYAQDDVDTEDPSNIKRFVSTFDAEQGGGLFRVYVQQISAKLVVVTVEFYELIVVTYSGGIRKVAIVNT
jgi:hypothetical protein